MWEPHGTDRCLQRSRDVAPAALSKAYRWHVCVTRSRSPHQHASTSALTPLRQVRQSNAAAGDDTRPRLRPRATDSCAERGAFAGPAPRRRPSNRSPTAVPRGSRSAESPSAVRGGGGGDAVGGGTAARGFHDAAVEHAAVDVRRLRPGRIRRGTVCFRVSADRAAHFAARDKLPSLI